MKMVNSFLLLLLGSFLLNAGGTRAQSGCACNERITVPRSGKMVLRVQSLTNIKTWETFNDHGHDDDNSLFSNGASRGCMYKSSYLPCNQHFRSRILDNWSAYNIDTVRVSVYLHGLEKQYVEFNGRGSNYLNWFSRDRIISSSWHDLRTEPQNYFSIKGDDETRWNIGRRFFINRNYGGCPHDRGWLIVLDEPDVCSWAGVRDYPVILYSKRSTNVYWNSGNDVGRADALIVTVKVRD